MRRKRSKTHQASALPRVDTLTKQHEKDPYRTHEKLPDPTTCTSCGAIFRDGRWAWGAAPVDANQAVCPACRRIADDYPAGIVVLEGEFLAQHAEEIRNLAHNVEEREKAEHPIKRIMRIDGREGDGLEIATTDAHLARGIGEAIRHAYQGTLDYQFTEVENVLRVHWSR